MIKIWKKNEKLKYFLNKILKWLSGPQELILFLIWAFEHNNLPTMPL